MTDLAQKVETWPIQRAEIFEGDWLEEIVWRDSFLTEAVSAAPPAEWDVTCRYESARVLTTVTSHVRDLLSCQGIIIIITIVIITYQRTLVRYIPKACVGVVVVECLKAVCCVKLATKSRQLACKVLASTIRPIPRSNHHLSDTHRHWFLTVAPWSFNGDGYVGVRLFIIACSHLSSQFDFKSRNHHKFLCRYFNKQVTWLASPRSKVQVHICLLVPGALWWVLLQQSIMLQLFFIVECGIMHYLCAMRVLEIQA